MFYNRGHVIKSSDSRMPAGRGNGSSGLEEVWNGNNGLSKAIDDIFGIDFDLKRFYFMFYSLHSITHY